MPMKFPSATKLMYETGAVSNGSFGDLGTVNIPKDLSLINRRGYDSTDSKGVPYLYRVRIDWLPSGLDGSGYVANASSDVRTSIKFLACQNNWVMKNAAIKWQSALDQMRKSNGIKKSEVGTYAKVVRYGYDNANDSYLTPSDGTGTAFTGGTWDYTRFANTSDAGFGLKLVGIGLDEDSDSGVTALHIGHSYLSSRRQPDTDSNEGTEETPAEFSYLMDILNPLANDTRKDEIRSFTQDDGDNTPYEIFATETTNHDITEEVEVGRLVLYPSINSGIVSTVIDVPFGLFQIQGCNRDPGDNSGIVDDMAFSMEVIDIFPMMG